MVCVLGMVKVVMHYLNVNKLNRATYAESIIMHVNGIRFLIHVYLYCVKI